MKRSENSAGRIGATAARFSALAGLLFLLAACQSQPAPQLTGSQGGLLPGMVLPEKPKPAPLGYTGSTDQVLPDGHLLRRQIFNGMVVSQTWMSSLGVPERQIFYEGGSTVVSLVEFGLDGQRAKQTTYFPGTLQPSRVEEYAGGNRVVRFTEFWPNGRPRVLSEADVSTPAGVVNRIQQWYENGRPKSLAEEGILRDESGNPVGKFLQGRQTQWDEDGYVVADADYDHDVVKHDYLVEAKKYPQ